MRGTAFRRGTGPLLVMLCVLAAGPAGPQRASAARLVGGARQAAVERAFFARGAHRGQVIASVRASSLGRGWFVVKSVVPVSTGSTRPGVAVPRLLATYGHQVGTTVRFHRPPAAVLADLRHRFTVELDYTGSGREAITDVVHTPGVCRGQGGFTETTTDTVSPMRWSVRYEVDPDDLLSAVRGPGGPVLVPRVSFLRAGSTLSAVERLADSAVDLSCAGRTTRYRCLRTWRLAPSSDLLQIGTVSGLEIGVPDRATGTGTGCGDADYATGASRWALGDATAQVRSLRIVGGRLPADPYVPMSVTSVSNAALADFGQGPCAATGTGCSDAFTWQGAVSLVPRDGA